MFEKPDILGRPDLVRWVNAFSHHLMKHQIKSAGLLLTLAISLSACQRSSKPEHAQSNDTTAVAEPVKPGKSAMPETMMKHMRNLEQDVGALASSAEKDHAALAKKIDGHTQQVISACTMEGRAHDTLHEWLMPFLQLNKDYAVAPDEVAKAAKFKEIQDALAVFHERFE